MNVNPLIESLEKKFSIPVAQDEYDGKSDKYIIYTYEDERPVYFGDDKTLQDTAYLTVQLIVPKQFNYMNLKHQIRDELERMEFIVTDIRSFLSSAINGTNKIRRITFDVNYTDNH